MGVMKDFAKFITAILIVALFSCVSVFADDSEVTITKAVIDSNNTVTLNCNITNAVENQQISVMVIKFSNGTLDYDNVVYVDQFDYTNNFSVTFKINVSNIKDYVVRVGGSNISKPVYSAINKETGSLKGDINGDGRVTATDAMVVAQLVSGKRTNTEWYNISDINGDGRVTATDAMMIAQYVSGRRASL
jgi:hypothetical protein